VCKRQDRGLVKVTDILNAFVVAMLDVLITHYYYFIYFFVFQ